MDIKGEKSRRAIRWIAESRKLNPALNLNKLVHDAIAKYDLNPLEAEQLIQFYRKK